MKIIFFSLLIAASFSSGSAGEIVCPILSAQAAGLDILPICNLNGKLLECLLKFTATELENLKNILCKSKTSSEYVIKFLQALEKVECIIGYNIEILSDVANAQLVKDLADYINYLLYNNLKGTELTNTFITNDDNLGLCVPGKILNDVGQSLLNK